MRDTTKRDAVMVEFSEIASPFGSEREERMADAIVRLRAVLAKLREPTKMVMDVSVNAYLTSHAPMSLAEDWCAIEAAIRAAVAAAEQEVGA